MSLIPSQSVDEKTISLEESEDRSKQTKQCSDDASGADTTTESQQQQRVTSSYSQQISTDTNSASEQSAALVYNIRLRNVLLDVLLQLLTAPQEIFTQQ